MSGWSATPESTIAMVTPAPLNALSGALTGASFAACLATSMLGATGSSEATKSTRACSDSRATTEAGRLTDIQREEALSGLRTPPPRPWMSVFSAAPGERRKRTRTFILALPLRLAVWRALSLSFPGFNLVARPALAETETRQHEPPGKMAPPAAISSHHWHSYSRGPVHSNADAIWILRAANDYNELILGELLIQAATPESGVSGA